MPLTDPISVEVHGLAELEKALMDLPEAAAGKALSSALAAGALVIRKEAQRLIPVGSVPHYIGRKGKGKLAQPGNLRQQLRTRKMKNDKFSQTRAITFGASGFYGMFLEFGTTKMPARPILRPAFDSQKEAALDRIKERLRTNIEKAAQKAYLESLRAGR